MSKLKEWRKVVDDPLQATDGMKLVDEYIGKPLTVDAARCLSFRIDALYRTVRGEERNRCFAATQAEMQNALRIILKGDIE